MALVAEHRVVLGIDEKDLAGKVGIENVARQGFTDRAGGFGRADDGDGLGLQQGGQIVTLVVHNGVR